MCACQATTRATQFARGCGDEDLTELVASGEVPQESLLSRSTDITSSLLVCPKHFGPQKPPSTTAVQKAAIMSFQTWAIRAPGIVGLMLGNKTPKRKNGLIIVVARGYDELIGSSAISTLCTQEAMFPCGVVMQGEESKEDDRTTAAALTSRLLEGGGLDSALCVLATWLCFKRFELNFSSKTQSIYLYTYTVYITVGIFYSSVSSMRHGVQAASRSTRPILVQLPRWNAALSQMI